LTIDDCNAFIRRLIYQEARIRWPNKVRIESKIEETYYCLSVQKVGTNEEEEKKDNQRYTKEELEIKQAVGFSIVLKKIVESVSINISYKESTILYLINFF
jgi:poly(A)-specific ribonuclease